jgi:cytochrome P450
VCVVVLIAGHDTTMNSMALGTVALVRHPQAREYLLGNPDSLSNSIMELARFIAMSTMQPRVVSADFEWHGQQLRQGDYVLLMLAGGNRDPRVFPDPETLDMTRPTEMSLVFGTGIHHCIGPCQDAARGLRPSVPPFRRQIFQTASILPVFPAGPRGRVRLRTAATPEHAA